MATRRFGESVGGTRKKIKLVGGDFVRNAVLVELQQRGKRETQCGSRQDFFPDVCLLALSPSGRHERTVCTLVLCSRPIIAGCSAVLAVRRHCTFRSWVRAFVLCANVAKFKNKAKNEPPKRQPMCVVHGSIQEKKTLSSLRQLAAQSRA